MQASRLVAWSVVVAIVGVTVASGPLVPGVGFAESRIQDDGTTGNATVESVSVPDRMTLTYSADAEAYDLRIPDGSVTFANVTGGDVQVTFAVRVPAFEFTAQRLHIVSEGTTGTTTLAIRNSSVSSIAPQSGTYDGTVLVILQSDAGERLLRRSPITVEVRR